MNDETGSDHQKLAAEGDREAEDLKRQGDKLDEDIEATKSDWEHKQADASVPGAVPDPADEGDAAQAAESEPGESAENAAD
jgi:hypothetical protein